MLQATQPDGRVTYYVYGLGLMGEESDGAYRSYHYDYRGSTVALTDEAGHFTARFKYAPYGEVYTLGQTATPFRYNGRDGVMTDVSGLYYLRARYYQPEWRRFVNRDVVQGNIDDPQSLNRYTHVKDNPIISIDPTGLVGEPSIPNPTITAIRLLLHSPPAGYYNEDLFNLPIHQDAGKFYIKAGELLKEDNIDVMHPINPEQLFGSPRVGHDGVRNLSNENLICPGGPQGNDPIRGYREHQYGDDLSLPGSKIYVRGGHHQLEEIKRRVKVGEMSRETLIEIKISY